MVNSFAIYQNSRRIYPFGSLKLKSATKTRNLINICCLVQSAKNIFLKLPFFHWFFSKSALISVAGAVGPKENSTQSQS